MADARVLKSGLVGCSEAPLDGLMLTESNKSRVADRPRADEFFVSVSGCIVAVCFVLREKYHKFLAAVKILASLLVNSVIAATGRTEISWLVVVSRRVRTDC